jgi:hypothetical protein
MVLSMSLRISNVRTSPSMSKSWKYKTLSRLPALLDLNGHLLCHFCTASGTRDLPRKTAICIM